jgi:mannose-6-phosphate isomerase-like protein (cupin superfamily)
LRKGWKISRRLATDKDSEIAFICNAAEPIREEKLILSDASHSSCTLSSLTHVQEVAAMAVDTTNAEHYTWPSAIGDDLCDGWHLHRSEILSVIEERMPPGTAEQRHFHEHTTQFFYVLAGELTIELEGQAHHLLPNTGLTIPGQSPHQIFNRGTADARFLVISQPPSHGDRIPASK